MDEMDVLTDRQTDQSMDGWMDEKNFKYDSWYILINSTLGVVQAIVLVVCVFDCSIDPEIVNNSRTINSLAKI